LIVCVGNPVYDLIKTPYTRTDGRVLSGCSTNACLVFAKLGCRPVLVGTIGRDFAERFAGEMADYGIEARMQDSLESGGFRLIYDDKGDRTLDILGTAEPIREYPDDLLSAEVILFGPVLGDIPLPVVQQVKEKSKALLFLDPQGFLRRVNHNRVVRESGPEIPSLVKGFDFVKPNEYEAQVMTGVNPRERGREAIEILHSWGPKVAIITLAELGSLIYDGENFIEIPPYETTAIDSTGAGDTYAAGFIYEYLRSKDLYRAGCYGSAVASIMIENTGPSFPLDEDEVNERFQRLVDNG